MKYFFYIILFFFHPIWYPMYGGLIYLRYSPRYLPANYVSTAWMALLTTTIVVPAIFYVLFRVLGWMQSPFDVQPNRKKWLIYGYVAMLFVVTQKITSLQIVPELYFYMMSLIAGYLLIAIMSHFGMLASVFSMLIGVVTGFVLLLDMFYSLSLWWLIALLFFIGGSVASARIYSRQQNMFSVSLGWLFGFLPQLLMFYFLKN